MRKKVARSRSRASPIRVSAVRMAASTPSGGRLMNCADMSAISRSNSRWLGDGIPMGLLLLALRRDVADRRQHEAAVVGAQRAERDFDREPGTVPALSEQIGIAAAVPGSARGWTPPLRRRSPCGARRGRGRPSAARSVRRGDSRTGARVCWLARTIRPSPSASTTPLGDQLEGSAEQALGVGTAVAGPVERTVARFAHALCIEFVPESGRRRYRAPGNSL